jgi:hypothetical protein
MFFRSKYRPGDLWMTFECHDVAFHFEATQRTVITLRKVQPAHSKDDARKGFTCDALCEREPSSSVKAMFESLSRHEIPEGADKWGINSGDSLKPTFFANACTNGKDLHIQFSFAIDVLDSPVNARPVGMAFENGRTDDGLAAQRSRA